MKRKDYKEEKQKQNNLKQKIAEEDTKKGKQTQKEEKGEEA